MAWKNYDRERYARRPFEDMEVYRRRNFELTQENDKLKKRIQELEALVNGLIPNLDAMGEIYDTEERH